MNTPFIRALALGALLAAPLAVVCIAEDKPAALPPPADPTTLIVDLRENVPGIFSYSTWQDKTLHSASGLVVQGSSGAQGSGGFGRNLEPAMDLSDVTYVEIAFAVGVRNEVPELTVALNDVDGTQVAARVRIKQIVPGLPVWMRLRKDEFTRVAGQNGVDGVMDWKKVAQWHVQGDWTTPLPFHAVVIALRVRK